MAAMNSTSQGQKRQLLDRWAVLVIEVKRQIRGAVGEHEGSDARGQQPIEGAEPVEREIQSQPERRCPRNVDLGAADDPPGQARRETDDGAGDRCPRQASRAHELGGPLRARRARLAREVERPMPRHRCGVRMGVGLSMVQRYPRRDSTGAGRAPAATAGWPTTAPHDSRRTPRGVRTARTPSGLRVARQRHEPASKLASL